MGIQQELIDKYSEYTKHNPVFVLDRKARFSVENFMKTIPLINKEYRKRKLRVCYLVPSNYHMTRTKAILAEFQKQGLVDVPIKTVEAMHNVSADRRFLRKPVSGVCKGCDKKHGTKINEIKCPG